MIVPETFEGMPVYVIQDIPKRQLAQDVPVSPEFRAEINKWMREFFGVTNTCADGEVFMVKDFWNQRYFTMNPRTYAKLREAMRWNP